MNHPSFVFLADFAFGQLAGVCIVGLTAVVVPIIWFVALLDWAGNNRESAAKLLKWSAVILAAGLLIGFGLFKFSN